MMFIYKIYVIKRRNQENISISLNLQLCSLKHSKKERVYGLGDFPSQFVGEWLSHGILATLPDNTKAT